MSSDTRVRLVAEIDATSKGLVDALKQASGAVNDTSSNWKQQFSTLKDATSLVSQSVKNLSDLVGKVGDVDMDVSGIETVKEAVSSVSQTFDGVKGEIDSFVDKLVEMKQAASGMGMPVEEYQRFSEAVRQAGVSMDDAGQMMQSMRQKIQDFSNGVPEAQDAFGKLGITMEQLSSHSVTENFDSIIQSMKSITSPTEQAQASMEMFKTSMERAVKVSQEYNKLLTTQANNTFASDKDVQNAISLSSAIGKLGEQLSHLSTEKAKDADESRRFSSVEEVVMSTIEKSIEAQEKYNDSLDALITKLSGVKSAFQKVNESIGVNTSLFDAGSIANGGGFSESIMKMLGLLDEEKQRMAQIREIQENLGAPIDMQPWEDYKEHVENVFGTVEKMRDALKNEKMNIPTGDVERLDNVQRKIQDLERTLQVLGNTMVFVDHQMTDFENRNKALDFEVKTGDVQQSLEDLRASLAETLKPIALEAKVDIDASDVEKTKALLDSLKDKAVKGKVEFDMSALDKVRDKIAEAENAFKSIDWEGVAIDDAGFSALDERLQSLSPLLVSCGDELGGLVSHIEGIDPSVVSSINSEFETMGSTVASLSDSTARAGMTVDELGNAANDMTQRMQSLLDLLNSLSEEKKVNIDTSRLEECMRMVGKLRDTPLETRINASPLGEYKRQLEEVQARIEKIRYLAERNFLEKMWDGAKSGANAVVTVIGKIASAFAHPIRTAKILGSAIYSGVVVAVRTATSAVGTLANAIRHPIQSIKNMKRAMDEFVASTHRGKDGVSGIGNAAGSTAGTLKQVAGQLLGMGSVVALLVKGLRSMGQIIKAYILDPWQKASEEARKFQEWISKGQTRTADRNFSNAEAMENDLRKYVELQRKYKESGSFQDKYEVDKQKKVLGTYGIEWKYDSEADSVIKEQLEYANNKKIEALKSKIQALEKNNTALDEEYKDRDSYLKNDFFRNPDEKHRNKQRLVEIEEQKGENLETIQEIRAQIRALQKEDKYADWTAEGRAIGNDARARREREMEKSAKENMEKEKKAFDDASKKLEEWANDLSDNDRQKKLRAILQKYEELVEAGVDEEKARITAVDAVRKVLEEEASSEKQENERLMKTLEDRMNAYKEAYKSELEAAREVKRINDERLKSERELAEERRREIIDDRRERLDRKKSQFGFTLPDNFSFNESSSKRRKRRRNARLDERIDEKMRKREEGKKVHFTSREKKRINERRKIDKQDRQLQAALRQMTAADKQLKAAEMQERLAQELLKATTGRDEARDRRRKRGRDLKDAKAPKNSLNLTAEDLFNAARTKGLYAEGVGAPAGKVRQSNYDKMFAQLHKDLEDIKKKAYFVR